MKHLFSNTALKTKSRHHGCYSNAPECCVTLHLCTLPLFSSLMKINTNSTDNNKTKCSSITINKNTKASSSVCQSLVHHLYHFHFVFLWTRQSLTSLRAVFPSQTCWAICGWVYVWVWAQKHQHREVRKCASLTQMADIFLTPRVCLSLKKHNI